MTTQTSNHSQQDKTLTDTAYIGSSNTSIEYSEKVKTADANIQSVREELKKSLSEEKSK